MQSRTELYKKIIMPIILKHLPDAKIILYGSRARKDAREGSDIDIALDIGRKIESAIMTVIRGDLEDSDLPIMFDLVDFNALSEQMKQEIVKEGVLWQK